MLGVNTQYSHDTLAPNDFALIANLFDRGSDLHPSLRILTLAKNDSSASKIVRRQFNLDLVARQDFDVVHPHLS
jgi:hypothetical protein